jgi:hypothetical protein
MKYLIALLLGIATGAVLFAAVLIYNPFIGKSGLSPLEVSDSRTMSLAYSAVASESIVYTNDGESTIEPYPENVLQLWEATIRQSSAMATVLRDGRNQTVGLGIKLSSLSEQTRLLSGKALVDSVWYVYLPGRGAFFLEQTENYWDYLRSVVLPAYRSSANAWKGSWLGNVTAGPGALGTAKVTGSSGEFEGMDMLAVESISVKAWRVEGGPVAAEGRLLLELPDVVDVADAATEEAKQ